jgi:ATP-dependent Clp protease ATP-binding subunit ClpB
VTPAAREFLLKEGTDIKYGARHLKRAIEKFIVPPLANLRVTEQVRFGDMLVVDWNGRARELSFEREVQAPAVPAIAKSVRRAGAEVRAAGGGNAVEVFAGARARSANGVQVLSNDEK